MKKLITILFVCVLFITSCAFKKTNTNKGPILSQKIVVWNLFDNSEVFEGQIQAFRSKNPGVEIEYKKFSNVDDYEQLLINEIAEGRGPDIFAIKNSWIQKHKGKAFPLEVGSTKEAMNKQIFENTFLPVVSKDLIIDNKVYGVSLYVDTLALYYNKQILGDHFNLNKPADTWEKFSGQVETLSKKDNSIEGFSLAGVAMGGFKNIVRATDILFLLMLQYGSKFVDPVTGKIIFAENQGTIEGTGEKNTPSVFALDYYSSFGKGSFKNYSWNERMTARYAENSEVYPFVQGKVAMIFGYSYLYEDLKSIISQFRNSNKVTFQLTNLGVSEVPQITSFSQGSKRDSLASYFPLLVSRNSKNPNLAWDFLIYLSGKESLMDYNERTHKPSSRLDLIDDQKLDPIYGPFARQVGYSKSFPDLITDEKNYNKIFGDVIANVLSDKQTSQEALLEGQKIIQCLVDKFNKKEGMLEADCFK